MGNTKYDWPAIKQEYVTGNEPCMKKFFEVKGIGRGTYSRHCGGWKEERDEFLKHVDEQSREEIKKKKVLDATEQAEYMSSVVAGMLSRWQRLHKKLILWEKEFEQYEVPTAEGIANLAKQLNATARVLPDLMKCVELLAGRATDRPGDNGFNKAKLEALNKEFEEKVNRIMQTAKQGPLKIVRKKDPKAG